MHALQRVSGVLVGALVIGCGGPRPLLVLEERSATSVAAEVLVDINRVLGTALAAYGVTSVALIPVPRGGDRDVTTVAPNTVSCELGGTLTFQRSTMSSMVTYDNCQRDEHIRRNGIVRSVVTFSNPAGLGRVKVEAVTLDITVSVDSVSYAEVGGFDISYDNAAGSPFQFALGVTGTSLNTTISAAGAVLDELALSGFEFQITSAYGTPYIEIMRFGYEVDSSRLDGSITTQSLEDTRVQFDGDHPRLLPYSGGVSVTGAQAGELQIEVLGDDHFVPSPGQGQISLQLGTASSAPMWADWSTLIAMVAPAP